MTVGDERSDAARLERVHELVANDLLDYFARRVDSIEDAAELLADTLLVAWRRIDRLPRDDEGCRMWMFVTARGVLSNWRRGRRRRTALAASLREQLLVTSTHRVDDNEDPRASDVRSAIWSLPHTQKELVILVHWDGFSIVEAASVLGIRESTARGRYQRATIRLRKELASMRSAPVANATDAQIGRP